MRETEREGEAGRKRQGRRVVGNAALGIKPNGLFQFPVIWFNADMIPKIPSSLAR